MLVSLLDVPSDEAIYQLLSSQAVNEALLRLSKCVSSVGINRQGVELHISKNDLGPELLLADIEAGLDLVDALTKKERATHGGSKSVV